MYNSINKKARVTAVAVCIIYLFTHAAVQVSGAFVLCVLSIYLNVLGLKMHILLCSTVEQVNCANEIERRGLSEVGVYRVPG